MDFKKKISSLLLISLLISATINLESNNDNAHTTIQFSIDETTQNIDFDLNHELASFALDDYDMMCERIPLVQNPWWKRIALRSYDLWYGYYAFWTTVFRAGYEHCKNQMTIAYQLFLCKKKENSSSSS